MKEENVNNNSKTSNNKNEYTILSFIILIIIFLFQYSSKTEDIKMNIAFSNDPIKKSQINSANYIFWKYIILSQLSQGIYIFLTSNLNNEILNIYSFILSILLSFLFLTLFKNKLSINHNEIFVYGIFLLFTSIYSILLNEINLNYFIFDVFCRISELFINIIFINSFENECNKLINDIQIKNNLINNYLEKNEIILIFMKITFQFILSNLNNNIDFFKKIKINSPSNVLCLFFSLLIIFIYLYWNKNEDNKTIQEIKTQENNKKYKYKNIVILMIIEFFINNIYYIYKYRIIDLLKSIIPSSNNYYIYNLFIPSLLAGIASFRIIYIFYNGNFSIIAKINSGIFILGIIILQFSKDIKKNLYGSLLIETSFGLYSILDKRLRIYLLKNELNYSKNIIWLLLEIINVGIKMIVLNYSKYISKPILFNLILSFICFSIIFFSLENIIIKNENESKIEKEIKKKNE